MTHAEADKICDEACARLMEHFGSVQILATWEVADGSAISKRGRGNYFARAGMCRDFLAVDIAMENAAQVAHKINPPDDSDSWKNATP